MLRILMLAAVLALSPTDGRPDARTVIHVDDDAVPGGDGRGRFPYNNLPDAVAKAHAVSGPVLILVAPGTYLLDAPLKLERPMELRGSSVLLRDGDDLPTGEVDAGTETRIVGTAALGSVFANPLIAAGRTDGAVISDLAIRGFIVDGQPDSILISVRRVQNFRVVGNVMGKTLPTAGPLFGIETTASSGGIAGNYTTGMLSGIIVLAGYTASPAKVTVVGNRSVRNREGGVLLTGASYRLPELGDRLEALVHRNDLSDHASSTTSVGLRIFVMRRDLGEPGDTQSAGHVKALVKGNRIVGNQTGVVIDAGFPHRRVGTICDPRTFTGTIDVELQGNSLSGSLLRPALIAFTRNQASGDATALPRWGYLHNATFRIIDPDGSLAGARIDNPAVDPYVGPCPNDQTMEPLRNELIYSASNRPRR